MFDLAHALFRNTKLAAQGFERHAIFDQPPLTNDDEFAVGKISEGFRKPVELTARGLPAETPAPAPVAAWNPEPRSYYPGRDRPTG